MAMVWHWRPRRRPFLSPIYVGLTAYDTQKLKNMALTQPAGIDGAVVRKGAILGALSLYLDFINLFLLLLRIFGQGRD